MLQLKDIVKDYPTATTTVHALRKVSLNFRESEFVAILGPSGCGKTTMLNIIGGLDRYTSGDLVIGGVSTAEFDDEHWDAYRNATIGFVFQSYNLIPHLTVLENVELALKLVGEKKKTRRAKAEAALHRVNMHEEINKRPNQLSGGQMQRVAIARAIVNDPKIILADEPTGALDSELSVQVMDILQEISKTRLVIMVTHNAELAYRYCSRICKFKDGELIEDTNPFNPEEEKKALPSSEETAVAEDGKSVESIEEFVVAEDEKAQTDVTEIVTTDVLPSQSEEINVQSVQDETQEPKKKKKVSNHKRKVAMKRIGGDTKELFDKLGLNSLSKKKKHKDKAFKPTSMSAGMAFGLSLRNLISKRRRTFLTAFAGSIGIIGLALVLSISNGFNIYVDKMQTEMLAGVPLGIYQYNIKDSAVMDLMLNFTKEQDPAAYPDTDKIGINQGGDSSSLGFITKFIDVFLDGVTKNDLSEDFTAYMKNMPKEDYDAMSISYGLRYNLVRKSYDADGNVKYFDVSQNPEPTTAMGIATTVFGENGLQSKFWQTLVGDEQTMLKEYDLIGENSRYPQNKNEILLCINDDNSINKSLLTTFGIELYKKDADGNLVLGENGKPVELTADEITSDYFIGQTFKLIDNDDYYKYNDEDGYYENLDFNSTNLTWGYSSSAQGDLQSLYAGAENELKIVGVIRQKEKSMRSYVNSALCFTPELAEWALEKAYNSQVAAFQRQSEYMDNKITVFDELLDEVEITENKGFASLVSGAVLKFSYFCKAIGASKASGYITVYPANVTQKQAAGEYINAYKNAKGEQNGYFDVSAMFLYNINAILNLVSAMLIAVAAISLVVSTVMIGVITSNSVIERTREIGILRALGARKRDIRNVFLAETSLIGLASGIIGIVLTYILCPLISLIIKAVSGIGSLLHFNPLHALILVILSLALTVISGILPAIGASRKNVVDALRVD